ncbi:hypothetical protein Emed_003384 [Eimeria media]
MLRPSARLEGVEVQKASKRRLPDGTVWLNQFRVCEKLATTELSSVFRVEESDAATGAVTSFCCKRYRKLLLLRRREYRAGPQGMGFRTKLEDVKEEARMLAKLDHPRCLKLRAILDTDPDNPEGKIYFITNYLEGGALMVLKSVRDEAASLARGAVQVESESSPRMNETAALHDTPQREVFVPQLECQRTFTEAQAKCFIRDAAEGVLYHVKVDNLLVGADGRVCVGDFGSAEKMTEKGTVRHTKGTYMFMAPECLRPVEESKPYEGHDGRAADAWALGICTFGVVTIPDHPPVSDELRDFLRQLLQPEWRDRMTVSSILAHPWVASADFADAASYAQALIKQRAEENQMLMERLTLQDQ